MRVILVPVAGRPECTRALSVAFDLAARVGASVTGCHMRPHRYDDVRYAPTSGEGEWKRRSGSKTSRAAAKSLFEKKAAQASFPIRRKPSVESSAHWDEKVGSPVKLMGIVGPMADLIIAHRPVKNGGIADLFLGAALHESERPVLILPRSVPKAVGTRICIGWNQSPEAARTVASVMPLIAAADEVSIVVCGPEDRAGPKSRQLVHYLGHYGVKATCVHTRGRHIEDELLQSYRDLGANLLVTGAYSKSRWQEKIFGGTTEWLVRKSKLPVLMQQG
mgnify:CR=1 FL=1